MVSASGFAAMSRVAIKSANAGIAIGMQTPSAAGSVSVNAAARAVEKERVKDPARVNSVAEQDRDRDGTAMGLERASTSNQT